MFKNAPSHKGDSMKKNVKVIICAIVLTALIWLSVIPFGAIEIKRYYGDINNDSYVTTADAKLALLIATKIYTETLTGMDFEAADVKKDYEINTEDARLILRTASGLEKKVFMEGYEFEESPSDFLKRVNAARLKENPKARSLMLSQDLCNVARLAAEEYATQTGTAFASADGSLYYKLLDKNNISYTYADKIIVTASFGYKEACDEMLKNLQSKKAVCNGNFENFGVGAYSKDGHTFYWCIFLTD